MAYYIFQNIALLFHVRHLCDVQLNLKRYSYIIFITFSTFLSCPKHVGRLKICLSYILRKKIIFHIDVVILFITHLFFHRKYSYLNIPTNSIMFCTFYFCFQKRRWLVQVGKLFSFGGNVLFSLLSAAYIHFDLIFSTLLFYFFKFSKLGADYPFFRQYLQIYIRYMRLRLPIKVVSNMLTVITFVNTAHAL